MVAEWLANGWPITGWPMAGYLGKCLVQAHAFCRLNFMQVSVLCKRMPCAGSAFCKFHDFFDHMQCCVDYVCHGHAHLLKLSCHPTLTNLLELRRMLQKSALEHSSSAGPLFGASAGATVLLVFRFLTHGHLQDRSSSLEIHRPQLGGMLFWLDAQYIGLW